MGPWTLIISSALFALLSWLGYHIRSVVVDNCTHCDTGEGGQTLSPKSGNTLLTETLNALNPLLEYRSYQIKYLALIPLVPRMP